MKTKQLSLRASRVAYRVARRRGPRSRAENAHFFALSSPQFIRRPVAILLLLHLIPSGSPRSLLRRWERSFSRVRGKTILITALITRVEARGCFTSSRARGGRLNRINSGTLEADNFLRVLAVGLGRRTREFALPRSPFSLFLPAALYLFYVPTPFATVAPDKSVSAKVTD